MHIRSTSIAGFLLLRLLAGLRWWRPYTWRYQEEQVRIEKWLDAIARAASRDVALAGEIAACGPAHQRLWRYARARGSEFRSDCEDLFRQFVSGTSDGGACNQSCAQRSDGRPRGPGVGERGQQIPVLNQATKPVCRCRGVGQGKANKTTKEDKVMKRREFLTASGAVFASTAVAMPAIAQSAPEISWRLDLELPEVSRHHLWRGGSFRQAGRRAHRQPFQD